METIELWPFSQGEIDGTPDRFIDATETIQSCGKPSPTNRVTSSPVAGRALPILGVQALPNDGRAADDDAQNIASRRRIRRSTQRHQTNGAEL